MSDRIIALEGVRNFRDFGGYQTADGRRIRRGLLFRSGHHGEATADDIAHLDGLAIHFQADLRRPDERERQVARWQPREVLASDGGREMQAPHMNFLNRAQASPEDAEGWMVDYYRSAPFRAHHVELFSGWFDRLAGLEAREAALVNCAAGKDRTGILCALTKHALGVSDDDIIADYELTNVAVDVDGRLPEARAHFNEMLGKDYPGDVYRPFLGVRRPYLQAAFEAIEGEAGSIDAYLRDVLGVDDAMHASLRGRLIEPA